MLKIIKIKIKTHEFMNLCKKSKIKGIKKDITSITLKI